MNLEKINLTPKQPLESAPKEPEKLSSLDKIRAIKEEIEIDRQQTLIGQKAQERENKLLKEQLYQEEKVSLDTMITRRDEITQELAEIKLRRGEIMVKGKEVITEAKQDKEVEKTLRTKEVFIDVLVKKRPNGSNCKIKLAHLILS